jgi:hypothetical protein
MKMQEVILRAISKQITWWQAAEIIGMSDRHMRRCREQYERAVCCWSKDGHWANCTVQVRGLHSRVREPGLHPHGNKPPSTIRSGVVGQLSFGAAVLQFM